MDGLACRPCNQRVCAPGDFRCLTWLRPEQVADAAERESYLRSLDHDGSPTGYAFRCLHCGKLGGYSDCD